VEKSLCGIQKGGSALFQDVIDYAECPVPGKKGLFLLDSPGHDGEVVTGEVAAGAQIIVFTSGRGTPTGFPFVPVVKVTGNAKTYEKMKENIDINAGDIITDGVTLEQKGTELLEYVLAVANGTQTKAEAFGHGELFCITRK
jgi:altronate dehydratase large subunit